MKGMTQLPIQESVQIDRQRLGNIIHEMGPHVAHSVIGRSMGRVASGLAGLSQAATEGDMRNVSEIADQLSRDAWATGMTTLSIVAVAVADCARTDDAGALAAVIARLHRVAAQSLREVWAGPDDE